MVGSTSLMSSSRSRALTCSGDRVPSTLTRSRSASTSCRVGSVPRSASRRVSSTSSQTFSSILSAESSASRPLPRMLLDLTRRSRSRTRRPATGSGVSTGTVSRPATLSGTSTVSGPVEVDGARGRAFARRRAGRSSRRVPPPAPGTHGIVRVTLSGVVGDVLPGLSSGPESAHREPPGRREWAEEWGGCRSLP